MRLRCVHLHGCASSTEGSGETSEDTCHSEDPEAAPPPHLVLSEEERQQHEQTTVI